MQKKKWWARGLVLGAMASVAAPAAAELPTCGELGAWLAAQPAISEIISVGLLPAANPNRCELLFAVSERGGTAHGYAEGQNQRNVIRVGLPPNSVDGGSGGAQGAWNGRIMHIGGGGLVGSAPAITAATNEGYVGGSTDSGHTTAENGAFGNWGVIQATNQLNYGKLHDFVYQSLIHQVEWTKRLVQAYYGMAPARTYWNGFSTGGRQGLSVALTMGDQFDGILAGAPAIYHQQFRLADGWPTIVVRDKLIAIGQGLTTGQRTAAISAARAACGGNLDVNGNLLADDIVYDPRTCSFDAKALMCNAPGAPAAPNCLTTPQQAEAINMIWDGPRNAHGKRIWYPHDHVSVDFLWGVTAALPASAAQVIKWNHRDLEFDHNLVFLDQAAIDAAGNPPGAITYADEATLGSRVVADFSDIIDPRLTKARNRGTKILMWHGVADGGIRWRHTLDYYTRVAAHFGKGTPDYEALQPWFRFYMAPNIGHSAAAVPNRFQALVDWVENGIEPRPIANVGGGRTRPLCAYPQRIIYDGVGNPNDQSSYFCGGETRTRETICDGIRTVYKHENEAKTQAYGRYNEASCNPKSRVPLP